ncbi:hypothetical protein SLEP1_g7992 [Rubroshorea leprosula]|uniref:Uncharacterized protein n=1 Tax=Rubroshorea leprosula TaxID=152421 RepID=A0AAV5I5W8_9ROSI|nr:hypothetical protein SLEP1_g7992 [Rubroshorea leprosula]
MQSDSGHDSLSRCLLVILLIYGKAAREILCYGKFYLELDKI